MEREKQQVVTPVMNQPGQRSPQRGCLETRWFSHDQVRHWSDTGSGTDPVSNESFARIVWEHRKRPSVCKRPKSKAWVHWLSLTCHKATDSLTLTSPPAVWHTQVHQQSDTHKSTDSLTCHKSTDSLTHTSPLTVWHTHTHVQWLNLTHTSPPTESDANAFLVYYSRHQKQPARKESTQSWILLQKQAMFNICRSIETACKAISGVSTTITGLSKVGNELTLYGRAPRGGLGMWWCACCDPRSSAPLPACSASPTLLAVGPPAWCCTAQSQS